MMSECGVEGDSHRISTSCRKMAWPIYAVDRVARPKPPTFMLSLTQQRTHTVTGISFGA